MRLDWQEEGRLPSERYFVAPSPKVDWLQVVVGYIVEQVAGHCTDHTEVDTSCEDRSMDKVSRIGTASSDNPVEVQNMIPVDPYMVDSNCLVAEASLVDPEAVEALSWILSFRLQSPSLPLIPRHCDTQVDSAM